MLRFDYVFNFLDARNLSVVDLTGDSIRKIVCRTNFFRPAHAPPIRESGV